MHFQKTHIFPTDFNDFIKLLDEMSVDLRLLWDHVWHMKVTLSHFGLTLTTWESLWNHFGYIKAENRKHARHCREKQIFEGSNAG